VRGVGVSGQQHGMVVLDAQDKVLRPAKVRVPVLLLYCCRVASGVFKAVAGRQHFDQISFSIHQPIHARTRS
jgi:sugar (pentulose or hexulose) kinase